jgi:hypothetical protein
VECISGTVAGFARPRRAVKPKAAWRRAEGAGLTAKARTEQSSMSPQYASPSDTVREIKYQILQFVIADRFVGVGVGLPTTCVALDPFLSALIEGDGFLGLPPFFLTLVPAMLDRIDSL